MEAGHNFLARLGKTKLRPGGAEATDWLIEQADIKRDTKVLEVACNQGTTMVKLAKTYGCHVTGVDLDTKALEKAKANIRGNHLESLLSVQEGNAMDLPFEDNTFDVVINEAMLTMLVGDKKEKAIREYYRVLKPGGMLLTHDVLLRTDDPAKQKELRAGLSRTINVHVEPLDRTEWRRRFTDAGFVNFQKTGNMTLMNPAGMIRDEGLPRTLKIVRNALKPENRPMFKKMFGYFNSHAKELGYIANVSVKPGNAASAKQDQI